MISLLWKGFVVQGLQGALMKSQVYRKQVEKIEFSEGPEGVLECRWVPAASEGRIPPGIQASGCTSS